MLCMQEVFTTPTLSRAEVRWYDAASASEADRPAHAGGGAQALEVILGPIYEEEIRRLLQIGGGIDPTASIGKYARTTNARPRLREIFYSGRQTGYPRSRRHTPARVYIATDRHFPGRRIIGLNGAEIVLTLARRRALGYL